MEQLRVAVATDDGKSLMGRHFGDAGFYTLYDISATSHDHVGKVTNDLDEEEGHADPKKAKGVVGILKKQDVQVAVAKVFGPNIKRIKSKLVCVLTGHDQISVCLDYLVENYSEILEEHEKGEDRGFLNWRKV